MILGLDFIYILSPCGTKPIGRFVNCGFYLDCWLASFKYWLGMSIECIFQQTCHGSPLFRQALVGFKRGGQIWGNQRTNGEIWFWLLPRLRREYLSNFISFTFVHILIFSYLNVIRYSFQNINIPFSIHPFSPYFFMFSFHRIILYANLLIFHSTWIYLLWLKLFLFWLFSRLSSS